MPEISVQTFLPVAIATGAATLHRPAVLWPDIRRSTFRANLATLPTDRFASRSLFIYVVLGALDRPGGGGVHLRPESAEDRVRSPSQPLPSPFGGMLSSASDLRVHALDRALLRRRRRLCHNSGDATSAAQRPHCSFAMLFVCKLWRHRLSLGSGSSGGIFSPSLFMGATLGGRFGALALPSFPHAASTCPRCHCRHGGDGRQRHWRRNDLGHDGFRDDARL